VQESTPLDSGGRESDDDSGGGEPVPTAEPTPPADTGAPPADASISSEQAVTIAQQALAGVPSLPPLSEIEREWEHGRMTWKVEFGDDHKVYVDVVTGEIVKVDRDDDRDDDDRDDDGHDDDRNDDD
jgi:uncharacterized membrane protein YkoI